MTKHKHADLIHAWADGAEIQWFNGQNWLYFDNDNISWDSYCDFRIKPEEKKPVVRWLWAFYGGNSPWCATASFYTEEELRNLNPPKHIKLEWSRTEFPE
jgi:hypothetical protein